MERSNRPMAVAVVVAVTAVALAWATTSTTASAGSDNPAATASSTQQAPGLTQAQKKQVKKMATAIAKAQIKAAAPTLSVGTAATANRALVADRAITADQSTLATRAISADKATTADKATLADMATNAANAANAAKVGGLDVKKFSVTLASGGPATQLFNANGFVVTGTCAAGVPQLNASSTVGGRIRSVAVDGANAVFTNGTNALGAPGISITAGANGLGSVSAAFTAPSGVVTNVWLGYRNDAPGCAWFGNYMVG